MADECSRIAGDMIQRRDAALFSARAEGYAEGYVKALDVARVAVDEEFVRWNYDNETGLPKFDDVFDQLKSAYAGGEHGKAE